MSVYVLRHMLWPSSLASRSFGPLAYFPSLLPSLLPCYLILRSNMFIVWVLRSPFILPSILPPDIFPPKGELVYVYTADTEKNNLITFQ